MTAGGWREPRLIRGGAGKVCRQQNWVREEAADCNKTHKDLPAKPSFSRLLASGPCGNRMREGERENPRVWGPPKMTRTSNLGFNKHDPALLRHCPLIARETQHLFFPEKCLWCRFCGLSREFRRKRLIMPQLLPVLVPAENNGGTKLFPSISLLLILVNLE